MPYIQFVRTLGSSFIKEFTQVERQHSRDRYYVMLEFAVIPFKLAMLFDAFWKGNFVIRHR